MKLYHLVALRIEGETKWFSRFAVIAPTWQKAIEKFKATDAVGHDAVWVKAAGGDVFHFDPSFMELVPSAGIEGHYDHRFPINNTRVESWLNDHYRKGD